MKKAFLFLHAAVFPAGSLWSIPHTFNRGLANHQTIPKKKIKEV